MAKEIETAFVIRGDVSDEFITKLTTASERMQQLNEQANTLEQQSKSTDSLIKMGQKIDFTTQKLEGLTEGTKEWEKTLAALSGYYQVYDGLAQSLQKAGVDTFKLTQEQTRLNAELETSKALHAGMASTIQAEAYEVRKLAQEYANATQQLARMNAQEQARVNATYQAWQSSSPQNINIPGADNINYSASSVEGSLYNAYAQAEAQAAAQLAAEQRVRDQVSFDNWNAEFEARLQAQKIAQAAQKARYNQTSFLGGLGGFSFMGAGMATLGGALPAYLGGAAIRGAYDLAVASVKESMSFNQIVSELKAYTHATDAQTAALRDVAIQIGLNTVFTSSEAAKAMTYLGKAGWTTGQIQSGIGGVMNLAAASGEDIASVSSIVADTLGAFGMKAGEAQRFADVLAKTATRSNTDVGLMGETFKTSGPVAGALGYSIEDVSQMVGVLANVGIKGSRAGTTMRNILNAFAKGFTISGSNLGDYTFSAVDENGNQKSLRQTVDELREAFSKLSNTEKVSNAQTIASMRGYAGLLALVNASADEYERLAAEIEDAAGAAKEMADTRMDNLAGDVKYLTDAFDTLKIKIGDELTPELRGTVQLLTSVVRLASGESPELGDEGKSLLKNNIKNSLYTAITGGPLIHALGNMANSEYSPLHFLNELFLKADDYFVGRSANYTLPKIEEEAIDEVISANEDLEESYEQVLAAAKESIEGQFKLWDEAAEVIPKDIYELMDAQLSQAEYWKEYSSNLDALYLRAGSIPGLAEFVDANATGSADAVALMAGLVEATDAELTEFMRLYQENEYERNHASEVQAVTLNFYLNGSETTAGGALADAADEISLRVEDALRRIQEDRARVEIA